MYCAKQGHMCGNFNGSWPMTSSRIHMEEVRSYYKSTTKVRTVVHRPLNLILRQITRSISTMTEFI